MKAILLMRRIFLVILLATSSPAHANWGSIRWGMNLDEFVEIFGKVILAGSYVRLKAHQISKSTPISDLISSKAPVSVYFERSNSSVSAHLAAVEFRSSATYDKTIEILIAHYGKPITGLLHQTDCENPANRSTSSGGWEGARDIGCKPHAVFIDQKNTNIVEVEQYGREYPIGKRPRGRGYQLIRISDLRNSPYRM